MQTPRLFALLRMLMFSTMLSLIIPASLTAQTTAARPDRGIMPGASYSVSDVENVSLTNGNVQLTIPLASLPPIAGGKLKFTVSAIYNSKLWNVTRQENRLGQFYGCPSWVVDTPQLSDLGGWRIPMSSDARSIAPWSCSWRPVVPITIAIPRSRQVFSQCLVDAGTVKSINTCGVGLRS